MWIQYLDVTKTTDYWNRYNRCLSCFPRSDYIVCKMSRTGFLVDDALLDAAQNSYFIAVHEYAAERGCYLEHLSMSQGGDVIKSTCSWEGMLIRAYMSMHQGGDVI